MPVLPNIGSSRTISRERGPEREIDAPGHFGLAELERRDGGGHR